MKSSQVDREDYAAVQDIHPASSLEYRGRTLVWEGPVGQDSQGGSLAEC